MRMHVGASVARNPETPTTATIAPQAKKTAVKRGPAVKISHEGVAAKTAKSAKSELQLRLYIAGNTSRSAAALQNLKRLCETHFAGRYSIEIVDLLVNPKLAAGDQILAVPTLVRKFPVPMRKIIGDLSNEERVLVGLDVRPLA